MEVILITNTKHPDNTNSYLFGKALIEDDIVIDSYFDDDLIRVIHKPLAANDSTYSIYDSDAPCTLSYLQKCSRCQVIPLTNPTSFIADNPQLFI